MPFALKFSLALAAHASSGGRVLSPLVLIGALFVTLGLVCDAVIIARFVPAPQFRVTPKPWNLRDLGLAVAILFTAFLIPNLIYGLIAHLQHKEVMALAPYIIPAEMILRLLLLGGFLYFFRTRQPSLKTSLGLEAAPAGIAAGWGALFGFAIIPPVGVLVFASNVFCRLTGIHPSEQPIIDLFLQTQSLPLLATLTIFAVVVAPVFEEIVFRGFAYPALKQRFGLVPALFLVSAAFAINHLHLPSLVPLFVLALGLALAYELTGSLLASITMHALFNAVMLLQVFHQRAHP